jgi:multiple sugar transport system permease protein
MALDVTAGSTARRSSGGGIRSERRREMWTGLAFVFIPLLLYVFLYFGAMVYAAYISLFRWGLRGPRGFLGSHNYEQVLGDPIFWKAVTNTLYYVAVWVPLTMALGLFLAVIVNQGIRGQTFFRAAFYFPTLASSAAITVVWIFLLQPDGLFNSAREVVGLNPIFQALGYSNDFNWLGSSRTAMNAIILLNAWTTSGTVMLFYLTFLQQIGREIYDAASVDGAGNWQTFRYITFPLLRPAHFFVATLLVIGGFKLFDQAIIAGGRGGEPANALTTIVLFIYRSAITDSEFGYAAAVGVVLFVIIFTLTLAQRRLFGEAPSW